MHAPPPTRALPPDDAALLASLAERARALGVVLDAVALDRIARFHALLEDGNRRAALTRIIDFDDYLERHVLDALSLVAALDDEPAPTGILDLGSGAGIPAVPLAIAARGFGPWAAGRPEGLPAITALECEKKKAAFIREASRALGLDDRLDVEDARAEDLGRDPAHREGYDLVLARALAELRVAAELALPLVRPGGLFVAWKGPRAAEEIAAAGRALEVLAARVEAVIPSPLAGRELCLVKMRKLARTPARFPRRPGTVSKRPL